MNGDINVKYISNSCYYNVWLGFMAYSWLLNAKSCFYISGLVWFGLWHINHCRFF